MRSASGDFAGSSASRKLNAESRRRAGGAGGERAAHGGSQELDGPVRVRAVLARDRRSAAGPHGSSTGEASTSGSYSAPARERRESLTSALEASLRLVQSSPAQRRLPAPPQPHPEARREEALLEADELWLTIRAEARVDSEAEPALASFLYSTILAHRSLERSLAFHVGNKLASSTLLSTQLFSLILDTYMDDPGLRHALRADMRAVKERDPACVTYSQCLLNFKGYLACQAHRVAHRLWTQGRQALALALQSRISEVFDIDIHPAAVIGPGVLFDHGTGVVIGETAVIGENVSILHHVTLGGTGAVGGDRHPKVGDGVLIGAGAIVLGNIKIGDGAKIGAGSVVLTNVPPRTTAVGNPARLVGGKEQPMKLKEDPSETMDHTSFVASWSDYMI